MLKNRLLHIPENFKAKILVDIWHVFTARSWWIVIFSKSIDWRLMEETVFYLCSAHAFSFDQYFNLLGLSLLLLGCTHI